MNVSDFGSVATLSLSMLSLFTKSLFSIGTLLSGLEDIFLEVSEFSSLSSPNSTTVFSLSSLSSAIIVYLSGILVLITLRLVLLLILIENALSLNYFKSACNYAT